jgi:hypothetical protein
MKQTESISSIDSTVPKHPAPLESSSDLITVKAGRELTGRQKSTLNRWIREDLIYSEPSDDGGRLISRAELLSIHEKRAVRKRNIPDPAANENNEGQGERPTSTITAAQPKSGTEVAEPESVAAPVTHTNQQGTTAMSLSSSEQGHAIGDAPLEQRVQIRDISFDDSTRVRVKQDDKVISEYVEKMKAGEKFPPVDLFTDGCSKFIGDGWHRLLAAKRNGYLHFPAHVYRGGRPAAIRYALRANISHGLRLTSADKRHKVVLGLREFPSLSNNEIAGMCAVSELLVRTVRDTFLKNESRERGGADGKVYPAGKTSQRDAKHNDRVLLKKTVFLAKKMTIQTLTRLKELIDARLITSDKKPPGSSTGKPAL